MAGGEILNRDIVYASAKELPLIYRNLLMWLVGILKRYRAVQVGSKSYLLGYSKYTKIDNRVTPKTNFQRVRSWQIS